MEQHLIDLHCDTLSALYKMEKRPPSQRMISV